MNKRTNGDPRFFKLLTKIGDIYEKKTSDYSGNVPFQDMREVEDIGIPAWKGTIVRLLTKVGRLKTLTNKDDPQCDETMEDTLLDMACMCLITIILREDNKKGRKKLNGK